MADSALDNLTAALGTDLDDADLFLVLDGTNPPKKITRAELVKGLHGTGVAGDVLYHNGTTWLRRAKGTAGQVLAMNSGATAPEWASGGWQAITSWTYSSGSPTDISFTNLSGYRDIRIIFRGLANSGGETFLTVSTDNGASYLATGYASTAWDPTTSDNTTTSFQLQRGAAGTLYGYCDLLAFGTADTITQSGIVRIASARLSVSGGGRATAACDALKLTTAGAFTAGSVYILGMGVV